MSETYAALAVHALLVKPFAVSNRGKYGVSDLDFSAKWFIELLCEAAIEFDLCDLDPIEVVEGDLTVGAPIEIDDQMWFIIQKKDDTVYAYRQGSVAILQV